MKFTNGYWLTRLGYQMVYATQCVRAWQDGQDLVLLASGVPVRGRGDVLAGGTLEVRFSAPRKNIIRVSVTHFAGAADPGPWFQTREEPVSPEICLQEDFASLRSGDLTVRVPRTGAWGVEFLGRDGCRLTGSGFRGMARALEEDGEPASIQRHGKSYMIDSLDLAVGTYGTTYQKVIKVSATTLPGAYVEVNSPYTDLDITNLDTTGKFTFNAVFDHIGNNTISISASYPGKKPSLVEHTVYYVPPANEYTVKAWPLSAEGYSELLSNMAYRASYGQVYVITGVVQYAVSEKPQMVVINTSEDGKSQPVLVQNYSKTTWQVGQYYRLYGDAYNTYNSMPWLNVRYTYTK